ncbi:AraC-like DNA-binding protein [Roseivirga pacifica]|uniref:AraC-type DNA-binding protein n=1 Tax=Roseivirga pacifica TaxID=1267423 RepID=A0A1I0RMU9_9BACT|nr:helix-turn-helix transcriptional regulator [Roseivirga pacifica]RKQ49907.1 AraC-like DNA-binding protein [Roseivirga pacifica]SEW42585.1 AraC-type DNA-binding protein [Roseivirga pacifica]
MEPKLDVLQLKRFDESIQEFYCNTFSDHVERHHKEILVPHKHDFYLTVLFTRGSGIHEIDFNRYRIEPGAVFFLSPGQSHFWEPSADAEGVIFFHSKAFFDLAFNGRSVEDLPFFDSLFNPPQLVLSTNTDGFASRFSGVLEEYRGEAPFRGQVIRAMLDLLYLQLSRVYLKANDGKIGHVGTDAKHLAQFDQLVERYYKTDKSAGQYAQRMNMTVRHLNRITRALLNKPTTVLIMERVVLEAKRLLVNTNNSLTDVALALGFEDYAYFSRVFKKYSGLSPSQFAKQYKTAFLR